MKNIPRHTLGSESSNYDAEDMEKEKHDRVMTKDSYRLHNDLNAAYRREINLLDDYFSGFKAEEYPEEWQQKIIKYIYKRLTQSVRNDRGLGVGSHPWEERPARTMLVEEAIIADKILESIQEKNGWMMNEPYRKAFRDSNISSATWNCVGCTDDPDGITKLEIVKSCLENIKVSSRQNMVLCRYVGGLRKLAQYKVLLLIGMNEHEAMDSLKEMPF